MVEKLKELSEKIKTASTPNLFYERAMIYYSQNKLDLALHDCNEGLKLDANHQHCYCLLSEIYIKQKHFKELIDKCQKEIEECNTSPLPYIALGITFNEKMEYDKAIENFNKAIELDPNLVTAYNCRGDVYSNLKQYEQALKEYCKAIELDPNYVDAYNNRGVVYADQKQYVEALEEYNKAIELNPYLATLYINRGMLYADQNKFDDALTSINKAIELNPTSTDAYFSRAIIYNKKNQLKEALRDYKESEKFNSDAYLKSVINDKIKFIEARLEARKVKDNLSMVIENTENISSSISINKKRQNDFYSHNAILNSVDIPVFTVLRKWNSFTPIIGSGFRSSKGGGYFFKVGNKGIVIDPGFNFIENFMLEGHKFIEIDAILITHAHNDHTADLDSLLTLLHKYNDDLLGSYFEEKKDSIVDKVLESYGYSREDLRTDPSKKEDVENKVNKRYSESKKVITLYITSGTFKKFASFFALKKSINYKVIIIDAEITNTIEIDGLRINVIRASHDDIMSDNSSVGFCFEYGEFALVYSGDTGILEIEEFYENLKTKLNNKKIALLANIGGFKDSEKMYYNGAPNKKEIFYKNHLGRLGVARLVEILSPSLCIISEFGEEFSGYRIEIAKIFQEIYKDTVFLPADIGLKLNTNMEVCAIVESRRTILNHTNTLNQVGFKLEFINFKDIKTGEVEQISQLYYFKSGIDEISLGKSKVAQFYESFKY